MSYPIVLLWLFGALFLGYLLFTLWRRIEASKLERMLATTPFPQRYRAFLEHTVHYHALDSEERTRIERAILRFIHTKEFRGIRLEVTDEMRVVVAFYAALAGLYKMSDPYAGLATVLLYSGPFLVEEKFDDRGIVTSGAFELDGQSSTDTVVLSWEDARHEAYELQPDNVIIHECAHVLDFSEGDGNAWIETVDLAYGEYVEALQSGATAPGAVLLGAYASENEAEFFAVASERFFHTPARLRRELPEVFRALEGFYGCDPGRWGVEAPLPVKG